MPTDFAAAKAGHPHPPNALPIPIVMHVEMQTLQLNRNISSGTDAVPTRNCVGTRPLLSDIGGGGVNCPPLGSWLTHPPTPAQPASGGGCLPQPTWAVCTTGAGAHQSQTSREGEKDIWWTAGTARGGTGHLGLTHTETQRGRLRTACGQRRVDSKNSQMTPATPSTSSIRQLLGAADAQTAHPATFSTAPGTPTTGLRERGNDTSKSTGRSGRQNAATRCNMRREERVTVQGPVKEQQPDGLSHGGGGVDWPSLGILADPPTHPPTSENFSSGKKMKFVKGARIRRSILGTKLFFRLRTLHPSHVGSP